MNELTSILFFLIVFALVPLAAVGETIRDAAILAVAKAPAGQTGATTNVVAPSQAKQVGNTLAAKRVKVNFYINAISQINDENGEYEVDLWLDLFWYDEALAGKTIEDVDTNTLWTPNITLANARAITTLYESFDNSLESNTNVRLTQRLLATLFTRFALQRFPFDRQTLVLALESNGFDSNQLLLDFVTFEQPPAHSEQPLVQPIPLNKYFADDTQLEGWQLRDSQVVQQIRLLNYDKSSWSQLRIEIQAQRIAAPYVSKIILILLFLLIFVWGIFWLEVGEVRYRLLLLGTLLLSTTTLDYKLVQMLPRVAQTTLLDRYIALCYILLLASFLLVIIIRALAVNGRTTRALALNRAMLIAYPGIILVTTLVLFGFALW